MYKGFLHTHYLVVSLFLLLYVIKTVLLLSNKNDLLTIFSKKTRLFEIVISVLFLLTGIYLMTQIPYGGKYDYLLWIKLIMIFASIPIAVIGFRKQRKMLAALSLLMITGSFGLGEIYHKKKGIAATPEIKTDSHEVAATDGKSMYLANCVLCHGDNGKLGVAGAKDLSVSVLDVTGIKEIIVHGKGAMPAAPVNDEQATAIAEYVNSQIKGH